jgi:cysteine desulfurase/selenocysteine lyase
VLTESTRKQDFPNLSDRVYLNTSAEGIPPASVLRALEQYGQDKLLGMDGRLLHAQRYESVKTQVAPFFGLAASDIGLCSCASEAYNLAYAALALKPGDEVIINDLDFPAGATPWLAPNSPATVKVWRSKNGVLDVADLISLLGPNVRFVNTSLVSFYNGYQIDVEEVSTAVRKYSPAMLGVDVTQALGRQELRLAGADLIVSSTHKWLLASHGGGLIGVSPERASEWTVPAGGWLNLENAFEESRFDGVIPKYGAASFSVGMPNYPAIYAIDAALNYISTIGVANINKHATALSTLCRNAVAELPVELLGERNPKVESGIVSFKHPEFEKLNEALHRESVHVMAHAGRIRASIHGYNTEADIHEFIMQLKRALSTL